MKWFEEFCQDPAKECEINRFKKKVFTCHFICKNAVKAIVMQRDHPIESLKLISTHFTFDDWWNNVRMSVHFKKKKLTTRRGFEDKRLIVPIDRSFSILQKFFVLLFLWFSMASVAIPTNGWRSVMYIKDIHLAYVGFFRPLPLGLGWASMIAAYSGSRARWMNGLRWGPALK